MQVLQLLMYILLSTLLTDFHASADTPSWRDRADLLQFHTRIRENVQPPASYMRLMGYSYPMQQLANEWVGRCVYENPDFRRHPRYAGTLQILALYSGPDISIVNIMTSWENEKKDYFYANDSCKANCSNYKLLTWAHMLNFGCAMKRCDNIRPNLHVPTYLMACQYKVLREYHGGRSYISGESCSQCPMNYLCHRRQCLKVQERDIDNF